MSILGRDEILGASDLETEDVEVPEWGGVVRVRSLSIAEVEGWSGDIPADGEGAPRNVMTALLARTIVDENNERVFSQDDVEALGSKNAHAIVRVFRVALKLSALTEAAGEEIEGNSATGPDSATSSD